MKYLLAFGLSVIAFGGCNKNSKKTDDIVYKYYGYLYKASDSTPYANTSFVCYQGKPRSYVKDPKEKIIPFTTDANGYFSVDVVQIGGLGAMVCWPDGYSSYEGCPEYNSFLPKGEHKKSEYNAGKIYMY